MKNKLIRFLILTISAIICLSSVACGEQPTGDKNSLNGVENSSASENESSTELGSSVENSSIEDSSIIDTPDPDPKPDLGVVAGQEGWYTLVEKTIDGNDITDSFVFNAINLSGEEAYVHAADFSGLETQKGTFAVSGNTVKITIGIKIYSYLFDAQQATLTFSGKLNKQQVVMRYKYSENFEMSSQTGSVNFTDKLFGESLDENFYNYCPTAMMEGNDTMHVWYCSNKKSGNVTDYVAYRKGTLTPDGKWTFSEKQLVLQPTSDTWDSRHTCDPSVVKGKFEMGGENYEYLMAYLGCYTSNGCCNEVGIAVAKKPEGPWIKVDHLNPIANFYESADFNESSWGYGQPSVISYDGEGKILLIYTKGVKSGTYAYAEEWDFSDLDNAKLLRENALSSLGVVNASGQTDVINNADFAYDPHLQRLYCIKEDFPYPSDGNTDWITGSNTLLYIDLGENGLDTIFGEHRWNLGGKIIPSMTDFARNHNMGILTDGYGQLLNPYKVPILYTMSELRTDYPEWELGGQWPALHTYRIHGYVIETK